MKTIDECVEEMIKEKNNVIDKLLINDILDISRGIYPSYKDYVDYKKVIIEMIRKNNNYCRMDCDNNHTFTYYVEPVIINEDVFCYIVSKNNLK